MAVEIDLTHGDARCMFADLKSARDGLREAMSSQNLSDAGYYFGWLDSRLTLLAARAPADCKKKPTKEEVQRFGGGQDKP